MFSGGAFELLVFFVDKCVEVTYGSVMCSCWATC